MMMPTTLYSDSTVATKITTNDQTSPRTKHIDIKQQNVRKLRSQAVLRIMYVHTSEKPADALTRISTVEGLNDFISMMNPERLYTF